jgi:GNAT superfamily N-acetyltransferase
LGQPGISIHIARHDGTLVGWYELRAAPADQAVEIAYFGLVPGAVGRGLGKQLLACAVHDGWSRGAVRIWLHTCTLDHPHALPNYRARGFRAFRTEQYEVSDTDDA